MPRFRFQFSLRTLLIFVAVVAVVTSYLTFRVRVARLEQAACEEIARSDGSVYWDFQQTPTELDLWLYPDFFVDFDHDPHPAWLVSLLGCRPFSHVVAIDFRWGTDKKIDWDTVRGFGHVQYLRLEYYRITDADFEGIGRLSTLRSLWIGDQGDGRITDRGAAHLAKLKNLEMLDINFFPISDAGLEHLSTLTKLRVLEVHTFEVSDAGLAVLSRMRLLEGLRLDDHSITPAGIEQIARIPNLKWVTIVGGRRDAEFERLCEELQAMRPDIEIHFL